MINTIKWYQAIFGFLNQQQNLITFFAGMFPFIPERDCVYFEDFLKQPDILTHTILINFLSRYVSVYS